MFPTADCFEYCWTGMRRAAVRRRREERRGLRPEKEWGGDLWRWAGPSASFGKSAGDTGAGLEGNQTRPSGSGGEKRFWLSSLLYLGNNRYMRNSKVDRCNKGEKNVKMQCR